MTPDMVSLGCNPSNFLFFEHFEGPIGAVQVEKGSIQQ